jgi:hypothetical protein
MIWWIIFVLILGFWIYLLFKRTMRHINVIGTRIIVKYFDQNIKFETIFPLAGTITKKLVVGDQDFFLVQFDNGFTYNYKYYDKILIKERHVGYKIGGFGESYVQVFLPKQELKNDSYELTDFDPVVWASIRNI